MDECEQWRQQWRALAAKVEARMEAGAKEYGGRSYEASAEALVAEVQEEIMDIIGWSAILFQRVERLRQTVEKCRHKADIGSGGSDGPV